MAKIATPADAPESTAALDIAPMKPVTGEEMVRTMAAGLGKAVTDARAAGYVVDLPFPLDALDRIAISETAAVQKAGG